MLLHPATLSIPKETLAFIGTFAWVFLLLIACVLVGYALGPIVKRKEDTKEYKDRW